jgi:hypothetical protein
MKNFFQFIHDLQEALAIYSNPNAYTPPEYKTAEEIRLEREWDRRMKPSPAMEREAAKVWRRIRARERAAAARPKRDVHPWGGKANIAGWWHPKLQPYTFSHSTGYHVTQLVRNPSRFGISQQELHEGLKKEGYYYNQRGLGWYDKNGDEHMYTAERVKERIEAEDMDRAYEVQRVAYIKGWLKVYSGGREQSPSLEGIDRSSIKAALREIIEARPEHVDMDGRVEVREIGLTRNTDKYLYLQGKSIISYINS